MPYSDTLVGREELAVTTYLLAMLLDAAVELRHESHKCLDQCALLIGVTELVEQRLCEQHQSLCCNLPAGCPYDSTLLIASGDSFPSAACAQGE